MHYYEVAPTKIVRDGTSVFTYHAADSLSVGQLVMIPVGKTKLVGLVMKSVKKPSFITKPILEPLPQPPLPVHLTKLAAWMSDYYATPLALVLQTLLPRGITKKRRPKEQKNQTHVRKKTTFSLNPRQQSALDIINAPTPGSVLLHGITGSGKTAVYIEAAKQVLDNGQSVMVLVPEIALTSQLVAEFSQHFPSILLTHSRQTEAERHVVWQKALLSDKPIVAIGPRSVLFLPLKNIGLIVIDECHEPSFQQEQSPRYSALRVAATMSNLTNARVVLGSATPLVSDYYVASSTKRPIVTLPTKADPDAVTPRVSIVDMTKRGSFRKHRFFSNQLLSALEETFAEGKQALIFHNRRGSASSTLCENCGWKAGCPRCFIPLTLHADNHQLRCHICGYHDRVPTSCPECHHADIIHKGIGTKLIESELIKLFPKQTIARFDGDGDDSNSVEARYQDLYDGSIDLIIGTQVVAKGLDLPHLRTVGVVQADAGLSLPDYMAAERTFQLLSQVVGRVGRTHHPTNVIVQSYQPTHPAVVDGLSQNYKEFYNRTIALRRHTNFPPFCFLLKLTCIYKTEAAAIKNAQQIASELKKRAPQTVEILGPTPAFYERQRDTYRWQLVLKSPHRHELIALLEHVPRMHWQFQLDPLSLL
jgi:primosomal protein N' (replication factor Y)